MNIIFETNKQKRKQYLKKIYTSNRKWKREMQKMHLLITIGAIITISTIVTNITATSEIMTIIINIFTAFTIITIALQCIDTTITAKYKYAHPYSSQANGILTITDNYLIYKFWRATPKETLIEKQETATENEDAFVYAIKKSDIKKLTIDEYNICKITGNGVLVQPIWVINNQTNRIVNQKDFSFITAFDKDDADEIIKKYTKIRDI